MKKKWICKTCGFYKKVVPGEIRKNDYVYFFERNSGSNADYSMRLGKVISRKGTILTIFDNGDYFSLKDSEVYPEDAPVSFIYNMFGMCEC